MSDPTVLARLYDEYDHLAQGGTDISDHLPYLREHAHGAVAEFGVRGGVSTRALLAGVLDNGGHLWSVDIQDNPDLFWLGGTGQWSFLVADALGASAPVWVPKKLDVLFVDLDPHSEEQTTAMIDMWLPRVKPGGVALFHDTQWGGGTGVRDALNASGLEWEDRDGSNGLGVVRL